MSEAQKPWLVMVDGASRGNPGQAGCGAAICDENGTIVKELSRHLGRATNNVAEYEALLMGLEVLLQLGRKNIIVQSDSELLVKQLNGQYRVKDEKLKVLFQRAMTLLRQFDSYRILHVRREMNKLADRLANQGMTTWPSDKLRAKVDLAIALRAHARGEESPDSTGQGGR
jgi:ribonuclease HI